MVGIDFFEKCDLTKDFPRTFYGVQIGLLYETQQY